MGNVKAKKGKVRGVSEEPILVQYAGHLFRVKPGMAKVVFDERDGEWKLQVSFDGMMLTVATLKKVEGK